MLFIWSGGQRTSDAHSVVNFKFLISYILIILHLPLGLNHLTSYGSFSVLTGNLPSISIRNLENVWPDICLTFVSSAMYMYQFPTMNVIIKYSKYIIVKVRINKQI